MAAIDNITFRLDQLTSMNTMMVKTLELAEKAAKSNLPILLLGESGTGKTLLAKAIHLSSLRENNTFISFNASAMTDTLLESQLFGYEKGAFTGASQLTRGRFEMADHGTIFFDEIADMSSVAQAKVLRAVEYGEFERLGSEKTRTVDVRIISATNKPLLSLTKTGDFREDLFHRLNGVTLRIPALRERREDLPTMIAGQIQGLSARFNKEIEGISPDAFEKLMDYHWPGNLRELNRVIERAVCFCDGTTILLDNIIMNEEVFSYDQEIKNITQPEEKPSTLNLEDDLSLDKAINLHVNHVYALHNFNKSKTAEALGISRTRLDRKLAGQD
ncbi:MAG: sigma 54-interacting transcriptional regulator [Lentisphaeria bacterium]|nr:sigma 54-interacting transcriptional regulator [Lentisphaeria bacterium]